MQALLLDPARLKDIKEGCNLVGFLEVSQVTSHLLVRRTQQGQHLTLATPALYDGAELCVFWSSRAHSSFAVGVAGEQSGGKLPPSSGKGVPISCWPTGARVQAI